MRNSLRYVLTFVAAIIFTGCKKYDEGPRISFRSKENRLENSWKLDQKYVNGENQTLNKQDLNFRLRFMDKGFCSIEIDEGIYISSRNGTWEFTDNHKKIRTIFTYTFLGLTSTEITEYSILKLKEKELWLKETRQNGDVYEYHLIPE